ncbi:hypothetical protein DFA_11891 [Cavenderia fasciculata]|uniref:Uncharacterized protein n=1 Tax=Cavenderia fasciculata TaxID=261658 RepID=F4QEL6_CACFS|nr:uncharacterized protein DFA_11891 [Cavenderia fasciculata]EGG14127.1 hypothetical protein DFA_11891 [Cavenderia fasciculata]|eukprot:XP_004350835.1 hypothetical protein DFA_11891 [Cavenderia fasciculata]
MVNNNNNNILYMSQSNSSSSFFTSSMYMRPQHCSPTNNNITIFTNHPIPQSSFTNQSFIQHQSSSQSPVPNPVIKSTSFQATITIRRPT